jgi:3-dehydroquinate synthase
MTVVHYSGSYEIDFTGRAGVADLLPVGAPVITDSNVASLMRDWMAGREVHVVPAGEENKNLAQFGRALEWLAMIGLRRDGQVLAIGGGVIGDLAGFVAATYMRGVSFVQVPTTLLAQVDSSVGGKVGIDLPQGKNLAGAFHAPSLVLVCVEALATLDARQFANGMAEVCKYGFIRDAELVRELNDKNVTPASPDLESIVRRCIEHKRQVVEQDEFERFGVRATLNFGHTVGHAIEQATEYRKYLHGEAIAIGMSVEAQMSEMLGFAPKGTADAVRESLAKQNLPTSSDVLKHTDVLIAAMKRDKKSTRTGMAFSLLERIGECKLVENVSEEVALAALRVT